MRSPPAKPRARVLARRAECSGGKKAAAVVRINPLLRVCADDIAAVMPASPDGVVVTKASDRTSCDVAAEI